MLSQIMDRKTYEKLSERDIEYLSAVLDAEILKNQDIRKILLKTIDPHIAAFKPKG